ncbi:hypothetical protein FR483_n601R [Paramecium bursaria Chlorella virus FR483]|uniref:Uncharacterized protein n601R n=1 Tax=Paramecium bursaria Chlorella virus FR483 TaxID=399781 RepID=A7J7V5_PBCVF|nr:hypothetical protein FR483_n601R [Paramecium bursaria Chlorella virus FR483]ABT15886.1 hypothetical protein FR483_n601R [Paramecium bursaria Chlorella virus FR483]
MYTSFPERLWLIFSTLSMPPRNVDPTLARTIAGLLLSTRLISSVISIAPVSSLRITTDSSLRMFAIFLME